MKTEKHQWVLTTEYSDSDQLLVSDRVVVTSDVM